MRTQDAKNLSLPDLLSRLGHNPVRRNGNKLWYRSPFREESKPSFCVEPGRQVRWIFSDYGANIKGNILDFVMHYQHLPIKAALHWLEQIFSTVNLNITFEQHASISAPSPSQSPSPIKLYRIKPIQHPALLSYLHQRAIEIDLAKRYLWELHYYNTGRPLFALGWKTDLGGWCLRANNFKAALSPAGITSIGTNNYCLAIFEGMFDFLAALSHFHSIKPRGLVIILNSVNNRHYVKIK